mmetsp:Transcript_70441/g.165909  ORF Transcript_70441/g.165909 Transcript_70441/m.165909 type:complete len:206 (+) Transcript_70441:2965-3582(+)
MDLPAKREGHQVAHDVQPRLAAPAAKAGRKEGVEHAAQHARRHAGAMVLHRDDQLVGAQRAHPDMDLAAGLAVGVLDGVLDQRGQHLGQGAPKAQQVHVVAHIELAAHLVNLQRGRKAAHHFADQLQQRKAAALVTEVFGRGLQEGVHRRQGALQVGQHQTDTLLADPQMPLQLLALDLPGLQQQVHLRQVVLKRAGRDQRIAQR